jgi:hydrogenase expression/formation protein HypC
VELVESEPPFASAIVEFGGVRREVSVACVPEATAGDYVMVHAGIAISRVNADEAARVLETLRELDLDEPEFAADAPLPKGAKLK